MNPILADLQSVVTNDLPDAPSGKSFIAGLIGEHPSTYSRSPLVWNAAFRATGIDGHYVPIDVDATGVAEVLRLIRRHPRFLGCNVTVPYKQLVIPLVDELDASAEQVGAVNTVRREPDGRLIGAITDGRGAVDSLTGAGSSAGLVSTLDRASVLMIGAGGSGRAVAYAIAEAIGPKGRLFIANRTAETALALGLEVTARYANTQGLDEVDAPTLAPGIDLIVNTSTRGQSGLTSVGAKKVTMMEPYSALGPANPPSVEASPVESERDILRRWFAAAVPDIRINHDLSMRFVQGAAVSTRFFDLVYSPTETMMLKHAKWAGHPILNGRTMIDYQAAAAFCDFIVRDQLAETGRDVALSRHMVTRAMLQA
ncbi:MAG: shikimate dehydrogenase [Chloroflexota bacterium]